MEVIDMMDDTELEAWMAERRREWEAEVAAAGGLEAWRNQPGTWRPLRQREYLAYDCPHQRFRIIVETNDFKRDRTMERNEDADEKGIDWSEADNQEFAKQLMEGFFQETSPAQMAVIRDALQKYLDEWNDEREAARQARPDLFGTEPLPRL
jgi:hypothetical protein